MDSLMTNGNDMKHFVWDYAINAYGKHENTNVSISKFDWTELFKKNADFQVNCTCDIDRINVLMCLPRKCKLLSGRKAICMEASHRH